MNRFLSTCFVFTFAKMSAGNVSFSLNSFLTSTKNKINNTVEKTSKPNVTCVIGNESCDLDSAVSSITYSYFLFSNLVGKVSENKVDIILPVLNVERKNFPVKTEVKYFLNANNISENDLVFRDEIDLMNLNKEKRLKLVLVDHHVLQKDYEGLEDSVIKVLDHRPKDKKSKWTDAIARIETVGSCSTLVADEIIKADELILANNRDVATLLYGTIVLDTFCFSETTKRYTPLDREIADKCKLLGKIEQSEEDLCETLRKSKNDVSNLTLEQLLVKDMKLVKCIPISTLTTSVKRFLNKKDSLDSLKSFCKEYDAPLSILLGVEWDGEEHRRDVYIFCNEESAATNETVKDPSQLAEFIVRHLFNYTLMDLVFIENVHTGVLYKQNNTTLTRKHMLPIVENALNDFILTNDQQ